MASTLDPDTLMNLKLVLKDKLQSIMRKYSLYVRHIRLSLKDKGVSVRDFCSDLLTMPATDLAHQELNPFSSHKAELKKATNLNDIFDLLVTEYASFLDYDIFQSIVDTYQIDHGQEELKYPEHLKLYLEKHKLSEFIEVNPLQKKFTALSAELVLKIDIELTTKMSKIIDLKQAIAKNLRINFSTLRLLDIRDGCVVVSFLMPIPVAELIFNKHTLITEKQEEQFRALKVMRLECNGCTFNFAAKELKSKNSDCTYQKADT